MTVIRLPPPYAKRPVPQGVPALPGWLQTEFGNVQRAIAPIAALPGEVGVVDPAWPPGYVERYGAVADDATDNTRAINNATLSARGAIGWDGATYFSRWPVVFQGGAYRHSGTLNYFSEWRGAGRTATCWKYTGNTLAVDACGDATHRRLLKITGGYFDGTLAGAGARCLQIGWNMRSLKALDDLDIKNFGNHGLYFASDNWLLSFGSLLIVACGTQTVGASGIGAASVIGSILDVRFYDLNIELCGRVGGTVGGGIHIDGSLWTNARAFQVFGGDWESNTGAAEGMFVGVREVGLYGLYAESDAVTNTLVFEDVASFRVTGGSMSAHVAQETGVRAIGASAGSVGGVAYAGVFTTSSLRAEGSSVITVDTPCLGATGSTSGSGAIVTYQTTPF